MRNSDCVSIPQDMLETAVKTLISRGESRDNGQERSMGKTIKLFNELTGADLTETEGWLFMVLLKLSRASTGFDYDNFMDAAAYLALAQESEVKSDLANG